MESLLSIENAGEILSVSPWTLLRLWAKQGKLSTIKLGARRLVRRSDLDRIMAAGLGVQRGGKRKAPAKGSRGFRKAKCGR